EGRAQDDRSIEPAAAAKCKAFLRRVGSTLAPIGRVIGVAPVFAPHPLPDVASQVQQPLRRRSEREAADRRGATIAVVEVGPLGIWLHPSPGIGPPFSSPRGVLPLSLAR